MTTHITENSTIANTPFEDDLDGVVITLWLRWPPCHPGDSGRLPVAEFKSDSLMTIATAIRLANHTKRTFVETCAGIDNMMPSVGHDNEYVEWELKEYQNDDEALYIKYNIDGAEDDMTHLDNELSEEPAYKS